MEIFEYSRKDVSSIAKEFSVNLQKGLRNSLVLERQKKFGLNKLALQEIGVWHIFLRQFCSAFIYLLLGAIVVTLFLGEYTDALMIFIFLVINTILGFTQEYRSEKTVKFLNKYTLPRAKVLRKGKVEEVASEKLVPGDVIILEIGDKIPADVRLFEQSELIVDETILTGESVPVYKKTSALRTLPGAYHEAVNLGFSGTYVVKGRAKGVVLATGKDTAFGQIAGLATETQKVSDFEKGIASFSNFIVKLVMFTLFIIISANIFIKKGQVDFFELVVFFVALTVSVIPEALPLVTTFSLARGARRLAKNKMVVKRLSAIEDLGGIEILCSDKTGTLTKNKLTVANIYSDDTNKTLFFANLAAAFDLKQSKLVEPFDVALMRELNVTQKKQITEAQKIVEEPFDPRIRRNIVLAKTKNKYLLITRGAPEAVVKQCVGVDSATKKKIIKWMKNEGKQGHRVLAVGYKEEGADAGDKKIEEMMKVNDFVFAGIISFVDSIKPSAIAAVEKARKLGVRMIVITGDSLDVAGAVGYEIGLLKNPKQVMSGEKWEKMNPEKRSRCLDRYSVFARVSPEQKFKIIKALRVKHLVGFLGEGINDAPALKIAGVSLVVDSASDIARETADIVLLKKNLEVILDGVREGRQVFSNTTKYIKSTLASNFGNFFAVAMASLLIDFLPMLPIQILLVNLLSDAPMISVSTDTVDQDELESPRKYEVKDIIILAIILGLISMVFDFIFFGLFFKMSPEVLRTNWFVGSVLTELALIFSIRTKGLFFKGSKPSKSLSWLSLGVVVATLGLPFTSFGQNFFSFVPLAKDHLITILLLVAIYFICSETIKLFYYKSKFKST